MGFSISKVIHDNSSIEYTKVVNDNQLCRPEVEIVGGGEGSDHDGGGLPRGPARQPLKQLLRDVGHETGNEPEPRVQTRVQHVAGRQNGAGVRALEWKLLEL